METSGQAKTSRRKVTIVLERSTCATHEEQPDPSMSAADASDKGERSVRFVAKLRVDLSEICSSQQAKSNLFQWLFDSF